MWQAFVALVQLLKLLDHLAWFLGRGALAGILWTILAVWRLALQCAGVDVDRKSRRGAFDRGDRRGANFGDAFATTEVPERIVLSSRGDANKLEAKMRGWMRWREDYDIDNILATPKPSFEVVKAFYPHALHGKTKSGHAIQMEAPGQFSKLIKALRDRGFEDPTRAVVEHVSFVMSYAFANVDPRDLPNGRILRIIDMSRMDLADTTYEAFMFLKTMASSVSIAFPERVHRVVIVNPPSGFGVLWSVFSPLASPSTLARVKVCKTTEEARRVLEEDMDPRDIPREYGGRCICCGKDGPGDKGGSPALASFRAIGGVDACPSASMSSCWRDDALERELWRDAAALNAGSSGGGGSRGSGRGRRGRSGDSKAGRGRSEAGTTPKFRKTNGRTRAEAGTGTKGGGSRRRTGVGVGGGGEGASGSEASGSWFW